MQESDQYLFEQGHKAIAEFLRENRQHLLDLPIRQEEMELLDIAARARPRQCFHKELAATLRVGKKKLSTRKKELNKALRSFCRQFEIEPPIQVYFKSSVVHKAGTHLACSRPPNTNSSSEYVPLDTLQSVLDKAADRLKVEYGAAGEDRAKVEAQLREQLKAEADSHLRTKLHERDDYQSLEMEIGLPPDKSEQGWAYGFRADKLSLPDHNRRWEPFARHCLLNMEGSYILTSNAGMGKTTFLRHLQLVILDNKALIPIYLHAREIEKWDPDSRSDFIQRIVKKLDLRIEERDIIEFLKDAFDNKHVVLLIDGLDQIQRFGTEYNLLIERIMRLSCGRLIIASRPSAVTCEEENLSITFLRLKPFDIRDRRAYFGKHYDLARRLSRTCPELAGIPMLACMLRTLIENKETEDVSNRTALYRRFMKHIFMEYKHEEAKLSREFRSRARESLRTISYSALEQTPPLVQKIPLDFCLRHASVNIDDLQRYGIVNLLERNSGLDDCFCFTHQSFQEYLAAEWAHDHEKAIAHILGEMWNPKWREVIKFLAGLRGEEFVRQIYSPECKDNSIHSRLFLAAESYGEVGSVCESEKAILGKLRELAWQTPFELDSALSLSHLNCSEAVDFVVEVAANAAGPWPIPGQSIPYGLAHINRCCVQLLSLVKTKVVPRHVDRLLTMFETNEGSDEYFDGVLMLGEIAELLTVDDIDRVIDLELNCKFGQSGIARGWPFLAHRFCPSNIHRLFALIASGDEYTKFRFLDLLSRLIGIYADLLRERKRGQHTGEDFCNLLSGYDLGLLALPHAGMLIDWVETGSDQVRQYAWWTMVHLLTIGVLRPYHIDWVIGIITRGNGFSREIALSLGHVAEALSPSDRTTILDFLLRHPESNMLGRIISMYPTWTEITDEELAKIVDALATQHSSDLLQVLEEIDCVLSPHQIDKVIDILATGDQSLVHAAQRALSCFVKDIGPRQVDRLLEELSSADPNTAYNSVLAERLAGPHHGGSYCPIPKELTEDQIKQIASWLGDSHGFRLKLGIEILANMGENLPDEYCEKIVTLLPSAEPDVAQIALYALGKVAEKLKPAGIDKLIGCLNSRHENVREAAACCLREAKERLTSSHVASIIRLLIEGDTNVANNALTILSEIPEKVLTEALEMIISLLEVDTPDKFFAAQQVSKFADRLGQQQIDRILSYAQTDNTGQKERAIEALGCMGVIVPMDLFDEIVQYTQESTPGLRYTATNYLLRVARNLTKEHVKSLVEFYRRDPGNQDLQKAVSEIPSTLLARHIDDFIDLLDQQGPHVEGYIWEVLVSLAGEFKPAHIKHFEEMLNGPDLEIRIEAYKCLKMSYSLRGLPS